MSADTLSTFPYVRVRLACRMCSRQGSDRLARLAAKYGSEIDMRDLLEMLAGDCAHWRPRHPGLPGCGAYFRDLDDRPPPDLPRGPVMPASSPFRQMQEEPILLKGVAERLGVYPNRIHPRPTIHIEEHEMATHHPSIEHHHKAAADHEAAAHHHREAAHQHKHGRHDLAKEHATAAHEHSGAAHSHTNNAHEHSQK